MLQIVECPRDAMQGITHQIPTATKVAYINTLLQCGFHTIDFGSFVSPKSIPQMADTAAVLNGLDLGNTSSKLLAIVANARGAQDAASHEEISFIGYPFSISETFQKRNTNASIDESLSRVDEINEISHRNGKQVVLYISMAFGNPYGEMWHPDIAIKWTEKLHSLFQIETIAMSDTIGTSNPESITALFSHIVPAFPKVNFGAHLHTTPELWEEKVHAAYEAGCRRFDGALKGFGGCPMASDDLTGNMPTEQMLTYFDARNIETSVDPDALSNALMASASVFG